ncbi:hypothetical protein AAFN86_03545 [Roseomonas sp. CAU 1739]|uniref:hypothetical protein n=1 Tax=Roseomonas sp. CAU 1739 TaxID=3140364 RepID=UPI00325BB157
MLNGVAPVMVIRDRSAIAAWVFMGIWMGFLALMTMVMSRDGPHPSQPAELQYGVLAAFWLVGIPVTAQVLASPCLRLVVDAAGGVAIHRRSMLAREVETFPPGSVQVELRPGKDDEGDPVWRVMLVARDGRERIARSGRVRQDEETQADLLRAALAAPLAESAPGA